MGILGTAPQENYEALRTSATGLLWVVVSVMGDSFRCVDRVRVAHASTGIQSVDNDAHRGMPRELLIEARAIGRSHKYSLTYWINITAQPTDAHG